MGTYFLHRASIRVVVWVARVGRYLRYFTPSLDGRSDGSVMLVIIAFLDPARRGLFSSAAYGRRSESGGRFLRRFERTLNQYDRS